MKRSIEERRVSALEVLRASKYEDSRAKRLGTATREEWQVAKDREIARLEELLHVRKKD